MKVRVYEKPDGSLSVVTFVNGKDPDEVWQRMKERDPSLPDAFTDMEHDQLPSRKDGDGVPCRNTWRLKAGKVKVDSTVRNPHRELHDKKKAIKALKAKAARTAKDNADLVILRSDVDDLLDELRGEE